MRFFMSVRNVGAGPERITSGDSLKTGCELSRAFVIISARSARTHLAETPKFAALTVRCPKENRSGRDLGLIWAYPEKPCGSRLRLIWATSDFGSPTPSSDSFRPI